MKKWNFRKWCDEWPLAGRGILLATREKRFWVGFLIAFVVFGTLMNLLSGGFSKFQLMWAVGLPGALKIVADAVLAILGVGKPVAEWLPTFALAMLQGVLIGLISLLMYKKQSRAPKMRLFSGRVARSRRHGARALILGRNLRKPSDEASSDTLDDITTESVQKAGIITGLIALGAGCPTCGTTLLTPLLGVFFSTGGLAVVGTISSIVTVVAVVVALLSLKRLGLETYVIIVNERYMRRKNESR